MCTWMSTCECNAQLYVCANIRLALDGARLGERVLQRTETSLCSLFIYLSTITPRTWSTRNHEKECKSLPQSRND